jgi:signal peptidase I
MNANLNPKNVQPLLREHLDQDGVIRFQASGGSMRPLIRSGDHVVVRPFDQLSSGDILLFQQDQNWFVHRLIRQVPGTDGKMRLILQGDARMAPDPSAEIEVVLGRVTAIERAGRVYPLDRTTARVYGNLIQRRWFRLLVLRVGLPIWRRLRRLRRSA